MEDKNFYYYHKNSDILTKYNRKVKNKQTIYFTCYKKRNGCPGKIKFEFNKKKWYLVNECKNSIVHENFEIDAINDLIASINNVDLNSGNEVKNDNDSLNHEKIYLDKNEEDNVEFLDVKRI